MAAITVDANAVKPVRFNNTNIDDAPLNAQHDPGTVLVQNTAGRFVSGNGGGTVRPGVLISRSTAGHGATRLIGPGAELDIGTGLDGYVPGTAVYATAAGTLDDVATGNVKIGEVFSVYGDKTPRRLLRLT